MSTASLLIAGLAGRPTALYAAAALSALQIVHFRLRERRFSAFPVQVRVAYAAILLVALPDPTQRLVWILAVGTLAQVVFGYCALARCLSLMPWNRRERLSWRLVWGTFAARPVAGSIVEGPAATS